MHGSRVVGSGSGQRRVNCVRYVQSVGDHRLADLGGTHESTVPSCKGAPGRSGAKREPYLSGQRCVDCLAGDTRLEEPHETIARRVVGLRGGAVSHARNGARRRAYAPTELAMLDRAAGRQSEELVVDTRASRCCCSPSTGPSITARDGARAVGEIQTTGRARARAPKSRNQHALSERSASCAASSCGVPPWHCESRVVPHSGGLP